MHTGPMASGLQLLGIGRQLGRLGSKQRDLLVSSHLSPLAQQLIGRPATPVERALAWQTVRRNEQNRQRG
jgi:hypothetical protein